MSVAMPVSTTAQLTTAQKNEVLKMLNEEMQNGQNGDEDFSVLRFEWHSTGALCCVIKVAQPELQNKWNHTLIDAFKEGFMESFDDEAKELFKNLSGSDRMYLKVFNLKGVNIANFPVRL